MEIYITIINIVIFLSIWIIFLIPRHYFPSYIKEKGRNLATKEDISDITKKIEEVRIEFASKSHTLIKKRKTYEKITRGMQVFIQGRPITDSGKKEMLETYSIAWLWANDTVLEKLNYHLKLQLKRSQDAESVNQNELKKSYRECILEMRKDSGYPSTEQKEKDFLFIHF